MADTFLGQIVNSKTPRKVGYTGVYNGKLVRITRVLDNKNLNVIDDDDKETFNISPGDLAGSRRSRKSRKSKRTRKSRKSRK